MKLHSLLKTTIPVLALLSILACRKEESEISGQDPRALVANSNVAVLLGNTSTFDGSYDNILDNANCIALDLPVSVTVNGQALVVESADDYLEVEAIFDAFDDDTDTIELQYPVTVLGSDFSQVVVNSDSELAALSQACGGENEADDDLECADIVYPVTVSIFNPSIELIDVVTINGDQDLFEFIKDLDSHVIASVNFPVSVLLADGTTVTAADLDQLEAILDSARDSCDEDDDYDYNDDDCDDCTTDYLSQVITSCTDWYVDKLEIGGTNLEDTYAGYGLNFASDGTITATDGTNTYFGTWSGSGTGSAIQVTIDIPNLSDFNAVWTLHEIQLYGEYKVDLRQANDDRLRIQSACAGGTNGTGGTGGGGSGSNTLGTVITSGTWSVLSYIDKGEDKTTSFAAYAFTFGTDGSVQASNGTAVNGSWAEASGGSELTLDFGLNIPLDEFNDSWDVVQLSDTRVELYHVSGGDGLSSTLIFEQQ